MKLSNSEKILLGVGVFLLAGTVLYLFLDNMNDERTKNLSEKKEQNKDKREASNYVANNEYNLVQKLGEKSRLHAMKAGLIRTTLSNEEIEQQLKQL